MLIEAFGARDGFRLVRSFPPLGILDLTGNFGEEFG